MGKTTFAMNLAENAAVSAEKTVAVFSMEMPGEQLAMRMMSSLGRIDQHNLEQNLANTEKGGVANVEYKLEDARKVIAKAGM